LLGIEDDAVALNAPEVAPAATVVDAGTLNRVLLLDSVTVDPPAGAACDTVTVQVLTPDCPRLDGLHPRLDINTGAVKLMVAVCWLLPIFAVTVALWLLGIDDDAVALNVPVVAPAVTVIVAGTLNRLLLLDSVTAEPPAGATCDNVTVHVLTPDWPRLDGLHPTLEINTGAVRLMVAVCRLLPIFAVTVALWLLGIDDDAVALNVPVLAPATTVIVPGTLSRLLLLDSVTVDPPAGAAGDTITVHVLTPDCPRLDGLHPRLDINTGAIRLMVAVCWLAPNFAVSVAL
jgi:hypothetical protein